MWRGLVKFFPFHPDLRIPKDSIWHTGCQGMISVCLENDLIERL